MKKILITTLLAIGSSCIAAALPFQQIIEEDVDLLFSIRNLTEMKESLSDHPVAEIFQDESLLEWFNRSNNFEKTQDESTGFFEEIEEVFGLDKDEFFELFPGQVSLAFYNISDRLLQKERMQFVFMAEFSGSEEQLNELMQIQFERNAEMQKAANPKIEHEMIEETFMGETLYFDETFNGETTYVEDGYALVEGILVLATPESRLREAVELIKEGTKTPLSDLGPYKRSREYSGHGDVRFYANLVELIPSLNAALEKLPIFDALVLFGITPQSLLSSLSLESMEGLFWDFDVVEDGIMGSYGLLYSEPSGLLSLLEYAEGELPEARYVPDTILSGSVTLFDISKMYGNLETILGNMSPNISGMIDVQLQTVQTNTGVDLRAGILENFGTQIVHFAVLKEDVSNAVELLQPQQVIIIDLKDAEAFSQALNALIDSGQSLRPMIEENTFEGETIYSISVPGKPPQTETEINYTITRSKFILAIGHVSLLHGVISKMGQENDGFWQDPDTIALLERIHQPNAVSRGYYDLEQLIVPFFKTIALSNNLGDASPQLLQSGKVPQSLKGSYRLVSEMNEATDVLFGRFLIIKASE